jgi:hypothetical protein
MWASQPEPKPVLRSEDLENLFRKRTEPSEYQISKLLSLRKRGVVAEKTAPEEFPITKPHLAELNTSKVDSAKESATTLNTTQHKGTATQSFLQSGPPDTSKVDLTKEFATTLNTTVNKGTVTQPYLQSGSPDTCRVDSATHPNPTQYKGTAIQSYLQSGQQKTSKVDSATTLNPTQHKETATQSYLQSGPPKTSEVNSATTLNPTQYNGTATQSYLQSGRAPKDSVTSPNLHTPLAQPSPSNADKTRENATTLDPPQHKKTYNIYATQSNLQSGSARPRNAVTSQNPNPPIRKPLELKDSIWASEPTPQPDPRDADTSHPFVKKNAPIKYELSPFSPKPAPLAERKATEPPQKTKTLVREPRGLKDSIWVSEPTSQPDLRADDTFRVSVKGRGPIKYELPQLLQNPAPLAETKAETNAPEPTEKIVPWDIGLEGSIHNPKHQPGYKAPIAYAKGQDTTDGRKAAGANSRVVMEYLKGGKPAGQTAGEYLREMEAIKKGKGYGGYGGDLLEWASDEEGM